MYSPHRPAPAPPSPPSPHTPSPRRAARPVNAYRPDAPQPRPPPPAHPRQLSAALPAPPPHPAHAYPLPQPQQTRQTSGTYLPQPQQTRKASGPYLPQPQHVRQTSGTYLPQPARQPSQGLYQTTQAHQTPQGYATAQPNHALQRYQSTPAYHLSQGYPQQPQPQPQPQPQQGHQRHAPSHGFQPQLVHQVSNVSQPQPARQSSYGYPPGFSYSPHHTPQPPPPPPPPPPHQQTAASQQEYPARQPHSAQYPYQQQVVGNANPQHASPQDSPKTNVLQSSPKQQPQQQQPGNPQQPHQQSEWRPEREPDREPVPVPEAELEPIESPPPMRRVNTAPSPRKQKSAATPASQTDSRKAPPSPEDHTFLPPPVRKQDQHSCGISSEHDVTPSSSPAQRPHNTPPLAGAQGFGFSPVTPLGKQDQPGDAERRISENIGERAKKDSSPYTPPWRSKGYDVARDLDSSQDLSSRTPGASKSQFDPAAEVIGQRVILATPERGDDHTILFLLFGFAVMLFTNLFGFLFLCCADRMHIVGKRKPAFLIGGVAGCLFNVAAIVLVYIFVIEGSPIRIGGV